jgi:hypothetical protein
MKPTWMAEFHSENCKNIFDICTRYNMQLLAKEDAKAAIEKCDLSNKAHFKDYVQRDLGTILAEEPKPRRGKRTELPLIDDAISDTVTVTVNAEIKDVTEDGVIVKLEPVLKNESHVVVLEENE